MSTSDLLYSTALAAVAFLAGFLVGQATAWRRSVNGDGKTVITPAIADNVTRKRYFGAFLVLMAVVTLGQGTYYNYEQGKCNADFRQTLEARSAIQRSDNANVVQLFTDISNDIATDPPLTDAERADLIAKFQARAEENARERAATPYSSSSC
ncbi:hypothetical protein CH296_11270 [Rhodococcus sp. 14-2496-1d]|uniref:hypothetical protein n=1 Tax=Rhodococcus sp. 14-2496-1d TaxID=2023146 RepID=UPI000B9B76CA|nr:hypothetical protein [Rhodococcus sp. 14-2496-1d]OZF33208.1 hypothetical protein CH296_11270 [Rhodococcus sp. 14-2496-1d]